MSETVKRRRTNRRHGNWDFAKKTQVDPAGPLYLSCVVPLSSTTLCPLVLRDLPLVGVEHDPVLGVLEGRQQGTDVIARRLAEEGQRLVRVAREDHLQEEAGDTSQQSKVYILDGYPVDGLFTLAAPYVRFSFLAAPQALAPSTPSVPSPFPSLNLNFNLLNFNFDLNHAPRRSPPVVPSGRSRAPAPCHCP